MYKTVLLVIGVLFLLFIIFFIGGVYFTNDYVSEEVNKLIKEAENTQSGTFSRNELDALPPVLAKYLSQVVEDGIQEPRFVRLKQKGSFKNNQNSGFKELDAEQYFITNKPGFLWRGKINFLSYIWLTGVDSYNEGSGNLLIKFMSGVTITRESGEEVKQAQLARWITETPWFPAALLPGDKLKWIASDSVSATARLDVDSISVEARFYFNDSGLIEKVTTQRYMTTVAGPKLTGYTCYFSNYKKLNDVFIPTHAEVEWNLEDKDFKYGKCDITDIQYDKFAEFD